MAYIEIVYWSNKMAEYDYVSGKKRVNDILKNELDVITQNELPNNDTLTYTNAYRSIVTGIFVDIRDSTTIFTEENKKNVSRIIRSFTSEVIEILNDGHNIRELGIRGDCVDGIFTTPKINDISEVLDMSFYINTLMKMLKMLFEENMLNTIKVGIGISTAQDLVVKAGRKGSGINSKVWIGDAVTMASNFSSLGNKGFNSSIVISCSTYDKIIEKFVIDNGEESRKWFKKNNDSKLGDYYTCSIIKSSFDKWIDDGMKE